MKYVLAILATLILFSCNKYDKRLDVILQAAQRGDLIFQIGGSEYINTDYSEYFTHEPASDKGTIIDQIQIPQYFDDYKFAKAKSNGLKTVHRSIILSRFGADGSKERNQIKEVFMAKESATLKGDVINYIEGEAKTKSFEFIVTSGSDRFRLTFHCMDSGSGFKIYLSTYERINL